MMHRRDLFKAAATGAAAALGSSSVLAADHEVSIVDTNVSLFHWPFRRLPLDTTNALIKKLRSLGIVEAWAGSFEGILHRDIAAVNQRLSDECRRWPELVPIGSINLELPDWERDVRQCFEQHNMPGIRLHPNYHGYRLDDSRFARLLELATAAGRFVQIAAAMEDTRTQHPKVRVDDVDFRALPNVMKRVARAKVQILNYRPRGASFDELLKTSGIYFDTARVDGTDGVPNLVEQAGRSRVMFGTHAPFLIPEASLIRVNESGLLDEAAIRSVSHETAGQVLTRAKNSSNAKAKATVSSNTDAFGLPLNDYRIWDSYFTPSHSHPGRDGARLIADIERAIPAIRKGKFEKLCYFAHVGIGTTTDVELERTLRTNPELVERPLKRWPGLLMGMIQLNANDVPASLDAINRWLCDGQMLGVYFPGSGPGALTCTHRNFDPLVERIAELNGVIMQHTWFKTGGKDRPGESTPSELAELASRFPQQKFLCAHAGGEWQRGIRAVRESPNILVETSGFDATAGFIEIALRELGAERIVFGSHLPSRSLGTELGKVIGAQITEKERRLILGENLRSLLRPILDGRA